MSPRRSTPDNDPIRRIDLLITLEGEAAELATFVDGVEGFDLQRKIARGKKKEEGRDAQDEEGGSKVVTMRFSTTDPQKAVDQTRRLGASIRRASSQAPKDFK
jgi:hypothetical protein